MTLTKDKYNEQKELFESMDDTSDLIDIYNILIEVLKDRGVLV